MSDYFERLAQDAWCRVPTRFGTVLVTNSFEDSPDGVCFVAVEDEYGQRCGWWATSALDSIESVTAALLSLADALDADVCFDEDFEEEYHVAMARGSMRVCVIGSYVRLLDERGRQLEGAFWSDADLAEEPERCWGDVLGAAASVAV